MRDRKYIISLEPGLKILEIFGESARRLTLNPITRKTVTSKQKLWDEIVQTRKRGCSICDRQFSMDLYSMAVPPINEGQEQ
jgi:DNA-binding IclR family transcriptional regulator